MIEREGPRREGGEGGAHVGVGGREALGEEGLHRAVRGAHLLRQEQQAGHVAPVEPAVAEGGEPRGHRPGIERLDRLGRARAEGQEHLRDAALDLRDGPEGEARGHEADHLPVGVRRLCPDELERVGGHEPVVVLAVQLVEPEA